jgi:CBS domain-containing protein
MYTARDVMCSDVITISVDATVGDAMRVLLEKDISGAPVVDEQGELVGIVSELQLLEAVYTPQIKKHSLRNFVTKNVLSVTENALLSDVANILVLHRIRRVPVLRDGRLVGIVSRRDLLRYALEAGETADPVKSAVGG